jgi:hypothetical protein
VFEQNNIFEIILHVHSPLKISSEYHCGSHKVYLLFWVRKSVAVTVCKQAPTPSALGGIAGFPSTSLGVLNRKEKKRIQKRKDCGKIVALMYKPSSLYCSLHLNHMIIDFVKYTA